MKAYSCVQKVDKKMTIAKQAEEYVKGYFKEKRHINLVKVGRSEPGFDFRDEFLKRFVEVKSSIYRRPQGFWFTNSEHDKAKSCQEKESEYEIHLVTGMGGELQGHYKVPVEVFLDQAKPEIWWYLTVRKADYDKYKLD